ncbi:VOC family protein [Acholeplasma granularum]|uniref:VOC family protein n=1 Tax=Acholeplasma granularum TaxID=264635 RepID=UPI00046F95C1|nr:VOC family protein [Acholeplasma granularum]
MENFHTSEFMQVTDVTLMVSDINKSLEFYQEKLGLKLINKQDNRYDLGTYTNKHLLTLINNPLSSPKQRTTGLYHFALLLPSRAHLGQFIQHMIETKTQVTGGADHGISEALYLDDPDGNGIEIYADKAKKDWPRFDEVVNSPMDYQDLVNNKVNEPFTKIPDETIMGHIHLHVANMDMARNFFINVLGFQNTMEYGPKAAFVSDNGYHHHIGFNVWNGINIPNNPSNVIGLKSYTLYVPKNAYEALKERLTTFKVVLGDDNGKEFIHDVNGVKVYLNTIL